MKAHKILIRRIPLADGPSKEHPAGALLLDELTEAIILNSPPGGSTTEQMIKACVLYSRFKEDEKKNDGAEAWDWWIDKSLHETLLVQLDGMRWATTTGEIRLMIAAFVKEIRESKETEVTITPASPTPA